MSTLNMPLFYIRLKRIPYNKITLSGSKYPRLEQISIAPKMFEPLKLGLYNYNNHEATVVIILAVYIKVGVVTILKRELIDI